MNDSIHSIKGALEINPEDLEAWAVYGDLLQSQGEPRGEMIALDLELRRNPDDQACLERRGSMLKIHKQSWLDTPELLAAVENRGKYGKFIELEWEFGFIRSAQIYGRLAGKGPRTENLLKSLLDSESSLFLRNLGISPSPLGRGAGTLENSINVLHDSGPRPVLRELVLGLDKSFSAGRIWDGGRLGELEPLLKNLPGLEKLHIAGSDLRLREFSPRRLKELRIKEQALNLDFLEALSRADLSQVMKLSLVVSNPEVVPPSTDWQGDTLELLELQRNPEEIKLFQSLLGNPTLGHLDSLEILNCAYNDDILMELATSGLIKRIQHLNLSEGGLRDIKAEMLLTYPDSFTHLRQLDLSRNQLSDGLVLELRQAYGNRIQLEEQRIPLRYLG